LQVHPLNAKIETIHTGNQKMSFTPEISQTFDTLTPLLLELFDSPYLNFGYWNQKDISFSQAQLALVDLFGRFSQLKKGVEVIDVGFGTGEQDLYYLDKFKCRHITGLNISNIQIEMASNKIKNKKKYSSTINFQWGDAMNLMSRPAESCDRLLALECGQLFEDKEAFINGAHHILRPKGYLCVAEPIINNKSAFDEESLPDIRSEINIPILRAPSPSTGEGWGEDDSVNLKKVLNEKVKFILKNEENLTHSHKNYNPFYDRYLKLLEDNGFTIEGTKDISKPVLKFYPVIKKVILNHLKTNPIQHPHNSILLTLLAIFFIRYHTFKNKSAGYYLIRARK
jgi:cyclopropane fatty-acyl-phospholipid synthase-like methyltransferase